MIPASRIRDAVQEVRELGLNRTFARVGWELKMRSGLLKRPVPVAEPHAVIDTNGLPFSDPAAVRAAMFGRIPIENIAKLSGIADHAARGRILCFSRWFADFGDPPDWHLHPASGRRWNSDAHWSEAIRDPVGDIKLTWEIGRFPHAFHIARAATFCPERAPELSKALFAQVQHFQRSNPLGHGVHWASSQEVAIRTWAWLFAVAVLPGGPDLSRDLNEAAAHTARHLEYAQKSVYNNHFVSEALCLYIAGRLLHQAEWLEEGRTILNEQAFAQIYPDGGYIQNSHTYHRFAMQVYLLANAFERGRHGWLGAMERSLDFLYAHQNTADGRLPNYGANDGGLPLVLSTCDYGDFRPTLQALSIATRGERLYEPGPWDEEAAWLLGPESLAAPLRARARKSISFPHCGYHVLRSGDSFAAFRCGSVRDRFSQIDMLHADIWWRGHNVLADAGSYLYNGPECWHNHFFRTASHNTVTIDGVDQMLHRRQFKSLYWTQARLTGFEEGIAEGEHYGYRRSCGCTHRRCIAVLNDDHFVVADTISGSGTHNIRLNWLCGPYTYSADRSKVLLATPTGPFTITVPGYMPTVFSGFEDPPRGWLSRYYGEKIPVASIAVEVRTTLPITLVTIFSAGVPNLTRSGDTWRVNNTRFRIAEGSIRLA